MLSWVYLCTFVYDTTGMFAWSLAGIVACAYIDHHLQNDENEADVILQDVFSANPVLIWSFKDALNPRVSIAKLKRMYIFGYINEHSTGKEVINVTCHMLKPKSHMLKLVDWFAIKYVICTIPLINCFHKLNNCDPQNMYNVAVWLWWLFHYSALKKEAVGPWKHWTMFVFSTCYNIQKIYK